jgi:hypothetical protein
MQAASGTLAAALTAPVRRLVLAATLTLGSAYDTLTPVVQSVTIDRSITSDLPDAAQLVEGFSSTQLTLQLAGDFLDGSGVTDVFTPYGGKLGVARRIGQAIAVSLGAITTAGTEVLPAFTGRTRSVGLGSDRTVTLVALDGAEMLRTKVTLPIAYKSDPGNLNAGTGVTPGWCADYILRRNGFYSTTPPNRASVLLSATMNGSVSPEVGAVTPGSSPGKFAGVAVQGPPAFATVADATTWVGLDRNDNGGPGTEVALSLTSTINPANGNSFIETYRFQMPARAGSGSARLLALIGPANLDGTELWVNNTTGVLSVIFFRAGGSATVASTLVLPAITCYLALHVAWAANSATANLRLNGTTQTLASGVLSSAPSEQIDRLVIDATGTVGHSIVGPVEVTSEAFSAGMWRDSTLFTLVPNAVLDPFLGEMTATPPVDNEAAWPLLQEIAQAEQGAITYLENGTVRFYNRNTLQNGAGPAVLTFASSRALKDLAASEAIDTVRNTIKVPAAQYQLPRVATVLWQLSETVFLASGESRVLPVQLPGPLVGAIPGVVNSGAGAAATAFPNSDGTGAAQAITWSWNPTSPTQGYIVILNATAAGYWVVDSSGSPNLTLSGRCIIPTDEPYLATATDPASAALFDDQVLEVGDNRFRQTGAAATALAAALLAALKDPHGVLSDVDVVGDLRLQLVDRVTIIDPAVTGAARTGPGHHRHDPHPRLGRPGRRPVGPHERMGLT